MALLARLHQGVLQMRTGNHGAALGVFEHVMRSNGASGEIRSIAGSCVAEVAFQAWERSGSGEDAERALQSLRSEVSSAAVGGRAYCRAQHRIGQLSSARGDTDAAVEVWRGLIAGTPDSSSAVQWVQSAGLALAALLEAKGDRAGAAAALDRVASFGGALAIEAVERAESVRLRGFLPLR